MAVTQQRTYEASPSKSGNVICGFLLRVVDIDCVVFVFVLPSSLIAVVFIHNCCAITLCSLTTVLPACTRCLRVSLLSLTHMSLICLSFLSHVSHLSLICVARLSLVSHSHVSHLSLTCLHFSHTAAQLPASRLEHAMAFLGSAYVFGGSINASGACVNIRGGVRAGLQLVCELRVFCMPPSRSAFLTMAASRCFSCSGWQHARSHALRGHRGRVVLARGGGHGAAHKLVDGNGMILVFIIFFSCHSASYVH